MTKGDQRVSLSSGRRTRRSPSPSRSPMWSSTWTHPCQAPHWRTGRRRTPSCPPPALNVCRHIHPIRGWDYLNPIPGWDIPHIPSQDGIIYIPSQDGISLTKKKYFMDKTSQDGQYYFHPRMGHPIPRKNISIHR